MNKLLTVIKVFLWIAAVLFSLEMGLQLKSYLNQRSAISPNARSSGIKVLVIGDSVMGSSREPGTIYSFLEKKLQQNSLRKVSLIEETAKGNYSGSVNYAIDGIINRYHPQVSIILLGNSDFIVEKETKDIQSSRYLGSLKKILYQSHLFKLFLSLNHQIKMDSSKLQEFREHPISTETFAEEEKLYQNYQRKESSCVEIAKLSHLRAMFVKQDTFPFLEDSKKCAEKLNKPEEKFSAYFSIARAYRELKAYKDSEVYLKKALEINPTSTGALENIYWNQEAQKNCPGMLTAIDQMLKSYEPRRQMLWTLRECFVRENKPDEGVVYFKNLSVKLSTNKELALLLSQSLSQKVSGEIHTESRDYYLSLLYNYKMKSLTEEANALYLKKDYYISSNAGGLDLESFRSILSKLIKDGSKVIVLQYPNETDLPMIEAVSPFADNVTFVSTSAILEKNLSKHNVFDFFSEDFIHVSPLAAELIASEVGEHVNGFLK